MYFNFTIFGILKVLSKQTFCAVEGYMRLVRVRLAACVDGCVVMKGRVEIRRADFRKFEFQFFRNWPPPSSQIFFVEKNITFFQSFYHSNSASHSFFQVQSFWRSSVTLFRTSIQSIQSFLPSASDVLFLQSPPYLLPSATQSFRELSLPLCSPI